MKYLLYIFLVLATLFTGIYLLPKHTPLFEYYRLRPVFETASITLLIGVLYLYRREKKQTGVMFSRLSQKNFFLDLAIQCGGIYIWEFKDEEFFFEYPVGDQSSRIELEEMWRHIHPDDLTSFKLLRQSLWKADKEVFQCRARFTGSDYEWWEFRFSAMPALDNAERGKDVSGILININDMKKREKELILMRGYEQKFLANMSHEIRTPLNAIVGFSDLLSDTSGFTEEEVKLFIETINKNCGLLLALINDILDLSRIESGTMDFQFAGHNLPLLMKNVYDSQRLNMPPGVQLVLKLPENSKKYLVTDNVRLQQVVNNLINNAVKFTTQGSITFGYTEEEPGYTSLFVEDTGKGISEDGLRHIFERFYKVDSFTQGAGLGLSICQTIVGRLNGMITVTSEEGHGTRFTVRLPDICE